jgi:Xaa-Pro aminopeptidase
MGLDALLVSQMENRRYLSGYTGDAGHLLITAQDALLATDFRYYEQVERQAPDFRLVKVAARYEEVFGQMIAETGAKRVGFESQVVTYDQFEGWKRALPDVKWVATKEIVEQIRVIKDEGELAIIRRAVILADQAAEHVIGLLRPGMTELEAAWELEVYMRTHGAEAIGFPFIVAAGPNASLPHAIPSTRPIQAGEPITLDLGAQVDGYRSDLTRTVCLGKPKDDTYLKVWNTVLEAQLRAEEGIRAGVSGREADALAREVITAAGYGDYFGHGLGHGVGLAIHEAPRASRLAETPLPAGATLTIEPGIYLPGWGGVRIEDMGVIRENGVEILTGCKKVAIV